MDPIAGRALSAYTDALRRGAGTGTEAAPAAGMGSAQAGPSFGDVLGQALDSAMATGARADQTSLAAASGKASVTDVVTALTNADVTLQAVVAVRDKVVAAYQDIMRMPI
ncbi:flagellar hook-basal body complex protein FliE [Oleomonas cavernae]|uniref:Flagellar hook-basal body complex protein FliE n=1 Tax=Oleomonas cavernae TaxID=2320859 RepID=A0A418WB04_9PROT|nr:flagellar hook-basal body complex protein FliE [Oleomonas cavernae]RJF87128.1 flagellar hook-basal body complex protein FliE [Oleomonas cavernae]